MGSSFFFEDGTKLITPSKIIPLFLKTTQPKENLQITEGEKIFANPPFKYNPQLERIPKKSDELEFFEKKSSEHK